MADQPGPIHPGASLEARDVSDQQGRARIRVQDFLAPESARRLSAELQTARTWHHVIHSESRVFEIPCPDYDAFPAERLERLARAENEAAAFGFHFRYDTIRIADDLHQATTLAERFALFMNAPETLAFLRRLTGRADIAFVDAQATRYRPGDFLTTHDDVVDGKHRTHAYTLGLSPTNWRPEWGGLLLFPENGGGKSQAFAPEFNTLSVFEVGQPHSVSYVAPFAPEPRLSITGWLRTRR